MKDVSIWVAEGSRIYNLPDADKSVLKAYEKLGIDCVKDFNGQFAFAIWDRDESKVFLARDRYGIKPLYYSIPTQAGKGSFDMDAFSFLLYSSNIKDILSYGYVKPEVDLEALSEYFTFQNVLSDRTIFKGIKILPAGCYAEWDSEKLTINRYWDYFLNDDALIDPTITGNVEFLLKQAVERQTVGDKTVGCFLSGGMDSSSIASIASQWVDRLPTFTCGFDLSSVSGIEMTWDERKYAELVSNEIKSEHYNVVLHAGDMEAVMPELIECLEDFRMGQCYPDYYVSRLASKFVKVVLSGTGGDEVFGGYPWRYQHGDCLSDYYHGRFVEDGDKRLLFTADVYRSVKDYSTREVFDSVFAQNPDIGSYNPMEKCFYFELKTFLHGLLVLLDKIGCKHSLESRYPFLDNDLVDYALRIPSVMKTNGIIGKKVLRSAMSGLIPNEILSRKKQGFSSPDSSWYRGESIDYVRRILVNPKARIYDYLSYDYVKTRLEGHFNGVSNQRPFIWSLLSFEWWLRRFML